MNNPTIIISAWNRPASLERLLKSLAEAEYKSISVDLIISLDAGGGDETRLIAENFQWRFGKKEIRIAETHLGLKDHILRCGDLTTEFGSIILLEDDLMVSPTFYSFVLESAVFFEPIAEVAAISLYKYEITEAGFLPFCPIEDGFDNWFMQHPSSWGFFINASNWNAFREFLKKNPELPDTEKIPSHIRGFSTQSWKKHFAHFLIEKKLLMVFPRVSFSTNFEDPGTHASTRNLFQVPLFSGKRNFLFSRPNESLAVYGPGFEILPAKLKLAVPVLASYDFECDFLAQKEKFTSPFVITTRKGNNPIFSWGLNMQPDVANLIQGIPGADIGLYRKEDVQAVPVSEEILFYRYGSLHRHMYVTAFNEWKEGFTKRTGPEIQHQARIAYKIALEKYPDISIIIPHSTAKKEELLTTLSNLKHQDYPFLKIIVVYETGENMTSYSATSNVQFVASEASASFIGTGIKNISGDLVIIAWPGTIFPTGALHEAGKIFRKFPHIQWLNGINSASAKNAIPPDGFPGAEFRYDPFWLQRCFTQGKKELSPGLFIARKIVWDHFDGWDFGNKDHLVFASFLAKNTEKHILHTAMLGMQYGNQGAFSSAQLKEAAVEIEKIQVPDFTLSLLLRPFFQANIPVLRAIYPFIHQLPEVLRYDIVNQTWYFSRY